MPGAPWLSKGKIQYLIALAEAGMSLKEIGKLTGASKTTIYYHVRGICRTNSVFDGSKWNEWERGYVVGLFIGDGNLAHVPSRGQYRVVFSFNLARDGPVSDELSMVLRKAHLCPFFVDYPLKNTRRVVCLSKALYSYLKSVSVYRTVRKGDFWIQRKSGIRDHERWGRDFLLGFVAGLLDSDAYVKRDGGRFNAIYATHSDLLAQQVGRILESLGIGYRSYWSVDVWRIRLATPSFKAMNAEINCVKGR